MADPTTPAERTLDAELASGRFAIGVDQGRWKLLKYTFPDVYVRITAEDGEAAIRFSYDFHLLCDGYPNPGPFVERWDFDQGVMPPAPTGSPAFTDALKEWGGGIYRAWQRGAATHNNWSNLRPDEAWNANRHISFIMERLFDVVAEQVSYMARRKAA